MDNRVLKVVERGRFGGEAVLPEVVLKFLNTILAGRKVGSWTALGLSLAFPPFDVRGRKLVSTKGRACKLYWTE
jgi:hypothetical protein